jgi:uncharacterized YigZ family protein
MSIIKPFRTIDSSTETRIKEKGSLFIGKVYSMQNSDDCMNKLNEIRKEYFDATHHCYCYKLKSGETKYSDNGEPSGTAGIRIQNAIEHFELEDVMVIVIRYFGGTKLGVGPLGKAYYESAFNVLQNSTIIMKNPHNNVTIKTNFDRMGHVFRILSSLNSKKITSDYKETSVEINCLLLTDDIPAIKEQLAEYSQGDIEIKVSPEIIYF